MSSAVSRFGRWRIKPSGKLPIFLRFMINSSFDHRIANAVGFRHHTVNRVYLNHMMYWPAKEYDPFENEIITNVKKRGWLEGYCERELQKSEELNRLGGRLKRMNWPEQSPAAMRRVLTELIEKYRHLMCSWYAQYPLDEYFETAIENELAKRLSIEHRDFRHHVLVFTDPKAMTEVAQEKWNLMKLAKDLKQRRERLTALSPWAKGSIQAHLKQYAYINRGLATSKPYTFRDIVSRIREAWSDRKGLQRLIYDSSPEKLRKDYAAALKRIKPNVAFRKLITQARLHSYTRNRRVEAFFYADYGASFMYHEIAKRAQFNPDWIMDVSVPEMFAAINGKKLPSVREMRKRFKNYAMVVRNAKTTLIVDPKAIKKLEKQYFVDVSDVRELHGKMACLGGLIRGRAKVCLDKHEIGKVERGDILIAQFTTPDFVPAMERAAAIVADQGGLSSHAAIVSRELGVPCVIGLKTATRVIHDNDLLEVDARRGTVKILKK